MNRFYQVGFYLLLVACIGLALTLASQTNRTAPTTATIPETIPNSKTTDLRQTEQRPTDHSYPSHSKTDTASSPDPLLIALDKLAQLKLAKNYGVNLNVLDRESKFLSQDIVSLFELTPQQEAQLNRSIRDTRTALISTSAENTRLIHTGPQTIQLEVASFAQTGTALYNALLEDFEIAMGKEKFAYFLGLADGHIESDFQYFGAQENDYLIERLPDVHTGVPFFRIHKTYNYGDSHGKSTSQFVGTEFLQQNYPDLASSISEEDLLALEITPEEKL